MLAFHVSYAEDGQASLRGLGGKDVHKWSSDDGAKARYLEDALRESTYTQYLDKMRLAQYGFRDYAILIGGAIAAAGYAAYKIATTAVSAVATAASAVVTAVGWPGLLGKAAWNVGKFAVTRLAALGTVGNILGSITKWGVLKPVAGGLWDMVKGLPIIGPIVSI
ncbi:hypothetical protein SPFM12_00036 [Salmonella phage SPFM12]|nr:hypothetical protein SPFM12_00036 [Salmonella phage SPFM12]